MSNPNPFDPSNPTPGRPTKITIKASDTKPFLCKCGCQVYSQGLMLRVVSVIMGGSGKPEPMPTLYCVKCFEPVWEFLPPDLKPMIEV